MRAIVRPQRNLTAWQRRELVLGLLFASPWLIHFVVLIFFPFFASIYYSLTAYTVLRPPTFIGLENYRRLLFDDPRFWISLYNTIYFTVFSVSLGTIIAIGLALALNMRVKGLAIYRTIYYLPSVTPLIAVAIVWLWLFNPQYGLINAAFNLVGLPTIGWLSDPRWAKPALVLMHLWGIGGTVVIYLAGLQDIPQELYEAAAIDGANWLQQTRHVTLPMLSPVILFNVIVGLIGAFQYFTQAYVMTQGGPGDATLFYSLYLYFSAFQFFKMGYASAMAWILFLLVLGCTLLVFRSSARWVYYHAEER